MSRRRYEEDSEDYDDEELPTSRRRRVNTEPEPEVEEPEPEPEPDVDLYNNIENDESSSPPPSPGPRTPPSSPPQHQDHETSKQSSSKKPTILPIIYSSTSPSYMPNTPPAGSKGVPSTSVTKLSPKIMKSPKRLPLQHGPRSLLDFSGIDQKLPENRSLFDEYIGKIAWGRVRHVTNRGFGFITLTAIFDPITGNLEASLPLNYLVNNKCDDLASMHYHVRRIAATSNQQHLNLNDWVQFKIILSDDQQNTTASEITGLFGSPISFVNRSSASPLTANFGDTYDRSYDAIPMPSGPSMPPPSMPPGPRRSLPPHRPDFYPNNNPHLNSNPNISQQPRRAGFSRFSPRQELLPSPAPARRGGPAGAPHFSGPPRQQTPHPHPPHPHHPQQPLRTRNFSQHGFQHQNYQFQNNDSASLECNEQGEFEGSDNFY